MTSPTDLQGGAQGSEYEILALTLAESIGKSGAEPMLAALLAWYPDPAARLGQLKRTVENVVGREALERAEREQREAEQRKAAYDEQEQKQALYGAPATPVIEAPRSRPTGEKKQRPTSGDPARSHIDGGYARVSNDVIENLMRVMPDSAFKAYVYACKLARPDGTFFISHETLAEKIGRKDHTSGQRAMALLVSAGLIRRVTVGRGARANDYQLVPVADMARAKELLAAGLPWTGSRSTDTAATA